MPTQQSLRTNQQPHTAHKKQHAPLTTVHSTQPPSPQQVTAPVHPIRTPLLPTPQIHTDTNRTRGGEGGDWQTVGRKQTCTHGRQANGQTHTVANTHWQRSTTYTRFHQPPVTAHAATTCISQSQQWGVSGWGKVGVRPLGAEFVGFPVVLTDRGAGVTGSGASAHGSMGWTSSRCGTAEAGPPSAGGCAGGGGVSGG